MLAGCAFQPRAAQHTGSTTTLVDDTAADFMPGQRTDIAIDSLGLLVPDAFIGGGLHARSYPSITMDDTTTWDTLGLGTMIGERYGEVPTTNWGGDRPYSLGLTTGGDYFTVTYDGEIYLPAGPTTLQLVADDQGFIEIDLGAVRSLLHAHYYDTKYATITVTPPAAGWYPVRGVISETYGSAYFVLSTVAGSVVTPITGDRLRARVTDAHGVTVVGTPDRIFGQPGTAASIEPSLADRTFDNTAPSYDFYGVSSTNHVLRYAGQLRVDTAEPYTFTLDNGTDATHHARLFVDGVAVAGNWPGGIDNKRTSDPVMLAPGWHDVIADYSIYYNSVDRVSLTASTPSQPAAPIPTERLRPVRTSGFVAYSHAPDTSVASDSSAAVSFTLPAPAGATIDFIDLFAYVTGATRSGLQVQLAGTSMPLPAMPPYELYYDNWAERSELAGMPADGSYAATFTTTGTTASLQYLYLVATYHGGPDAPFAQKMVYVSAPKPLDGTVTAVRALGDLHGAQMTVEVRTGEAGSIDVAPWVAPETMPSGDLVEYRLTITGDGWQYPAIDRVEIDVARADSP